MATTDDVYNELLVVRWLLATAPKTITFTFADASTVTLYRRFDCAASASTPAYANLANTSSVSWSGVVGSTGSWTLAHSGSTYSTDALGNNQFEDLTTAGAWSLTNGTGPAISSITLGTVFDLESKRPTKSYLAGTNNADGDVELNEATGGLAATALDSISTTGPNGVAANFRERMNQVWRLLFGRSAKTPTAITTYRDDNVTVATTQVISDDNAGSETRGVAT